MVELKLTLKDVDYDAILRQFGGSLGGPAALAARALPNAAKEELAVKYLNANAGMLAQKLEALAGSKGIGVKVASAQAKVV